jgi:hypothetical protein
MKNDRRLSAIKRKSQNKAIHRSRVSAFSDVEFFGRDISDHWRSDFLVLDHVLSFISGD